MKSMKKILLIFALSWTIVSIILCYRWKHVFLILFLPSLILAVGYALLFKFAKKLLFRCFFILGIISLFFVGFLSIYMKIRINRWGPVTDMRKYEELTQGFKHFPKKIPEDATDISFYYQPSLMMGAGHVQLRLKRPPAEIRKLHQEFSSKKIRSGLGSGQTEEVTRPTGLEVGAIYPSDYEIITLDESYGTGTSANSGVAISFERNEIIYWSDVWH
jgi:hypothetical protein